MSTPPHEAVERVQEIATRHPPALVHAGWAEAFPWLVQGTTTRGDSAKPFDLGLFSGGSPEREVRKSWAELRRATGASMAVHARQVHGARVRVHGVDAPLRGEGAPLPEGDGSLPEGDASLRGEGATVLVGACDGHATAAPGLLLAVTTADCVPVFVVDPGHRAVALLHAGWRGAVAGVLEEGLRAMGSAFGTDPAEAYLHLGPAICGRCYEVGPEVHEALGRAVPAGPTPIDLRAALAERAVAAGVPPDRVGVSSHCTLCTGSGLFSHRGGDAFRQVGYLGVRG